MERSEYKKAIERPLMKRLDSPEKLFLSKAGIREALADDDQNGRK